MQHSQHSFKLIRKMKYVFVNLKKKLEFVPFSIASQNLNCGSYINSSKGSQILAFFVDIEYKKAHFGPLIVRFNPMEVNRSVDLEGKTVLMLSNLS